VMPRAISPETGFDATTASADEVPTSGGVV